MKKIMMMLACSLITMTSMAKTGDKGDIEKVITTLMKGVDHQKGDEILKTFRENATVQATNQGKIISVDYKQFAAMHASKKFGGRDRSVEIVSVDITDGIMATAKVVAQDDKVHYVYYLNLSNTDGKWLIQSFLQHSKLK
ncbi:nuclear transport factor 2 family protein [Roseivirga sp. E12]|uniref:nuclear transport factor 2 family protein n=1 Tax=Roseivirga sp. E12 TaxID=2819237 RepID=UPI001ABC17C4|nr:nuclear transport factor 2 family protein [Roseivirga sp. E12]